MKEILNNDSRKFLYLLAWLVLVAFLAMPLISADLGVVKKNDCFNIRILANCSSIYITEVTSPNYTYKINTSMSNLGGQTFNYSFCNTSKTGYYSFSWNNPCIDCSEGNCGNSFKVTVTGDEMSTGKAVYYILIFIVSFIIFVGLILLAASLEGKNKTDQFTGYVLAISNLKYLRLFFFALSYVVAIFISYFTWMVCYAYLDMEFISTIFQFLFYSLVACLFPLLVLGAYFTISNLVRDSQISDLLQRGLTTRQNG